MKFIFVILAVFPQLVIAADKPSMTTLWLDLGLLVLMLVSLKIAQFSIKNKAIIFITYILGGIITKTIWLPVLLWIGLYIYFTKSSDEI